jgi:hypothetical protein
MVQDTEFEPDDFLSFFAIVFPSLIPHIFGAGRGIEPH